MLISSNRYFCSYKNLTFREKDISSWKTMSEWSIIVKIWSNVFEILFEEEKDVRLVWYLFIQINYIVCVINSSHIGVTPRMKSSRSTFAFVSP